MRKFTAILMTVLMIAGLFVSCNNNAPVVDETVSVSFDEAVSRNLTASLDKFDAENYYWAYKAEKKDNTGLNSGAKVFAWMKKGEKGLSGVTIPGFSQGTWAFTLYAYTDEGKDNAGYSETGLAYTGTNSNVTLVKGGGNVVSVTVSPITNGNGTLFVDISKIKIKNASGKVISNQDSYTKVVTVEPILSSIADPTLKQESTNYTYEAAPGAYKVTVGIVQNSITFASGSVVATVYSNLTTTVAGDLVEMVTDASFDPSINPDIINKVASSDSVDYSTISDTEPITLSESVTSGAKVEASVPNRAVAEAIKQVTNKDEVSNEEVSMSVSVYTASATSKSIELEISMSATVKYIDDSGTTVVETKPVSDFGEGNIITVQVELQKNLQNVKVTHNGDPMSEISESNSEGYSYVADTGILTIKTSSFSPFGITYDEPVYVATVGNVSYTTLQDAVDAASSNSTIVLTKDVVVTKTVTINKTININLNGHTITGNKVRALHIKEKTTNIYGPGTITSDVENVGSSVIRVGDNEASYSASLYINEGVVVKTDTAYGITLIGNNYKYLYVSGSVISNAPENNSYDGCAISTLGNDPKYSYIYIKDGATISAANTNAIYMPSGNLRVYESESTRITGRTGIYVKSGSTTIEGGTITGTGPAVAYNYYGNGGISTGDALVVDSCGYPKGNPKVSVKGGTLISENACAVGSYNTGENELVTGFITGGSLYSAGEFNESLIINDINYQITKNGNSYVVSEIVSSEENPISINNAQQFAQIKKGTSEQKRYYQLAENIDVSSVMKDGYVFKLKDSYDSGINNIVLNGNGKTISGFNNGYIFELIKESELKNINFTLDGANTAISREAQYNMIYNSVNVNGTISVNGNCGAYTIYAYKPNFTFNNCIANVDMSGTSYNAVFVGYVYSTDNYKNKLSFSGCKNEGSLICNYASMFIGNPNTNNIECVVDSCENSGTIQATDTDKVFNYYYSVTSNCHGDFIINNVVYNNIAGGKSSAPTCLEDSNITTTGQAIQGPNNTGLSISSNSDGTFTVTAAVIEGKTVHHYTVYVGVYATLKAGGSNRNYVTETITANNMTTIIKNLSFVDTQWLNEHIGAVEGELAGNTIYTLNGESYYMLKTPETDTLNGQVKAPQMIYVVAYDEKNKTLASARLIGNIS